MRIWNKFVDEYFCPALSMIGWHVMVRKVARSLDEKRLHPEILNNKDAPRTADWLQRMQDRPAVQEAMNMPNKVAETLAAIAG